MLSRLIHELARLNIDFDFKKKPEQKKFLENCLLKINGLAPQQLTTMVSTQKEFATFFKNQLQLNKIKLSQTEIATATAFLKKMLELKLFFNQLTVSWQEANKDLPPQDQTHLGGDQILPYLIFLLNKENFQLKSENNLTTITNSVSLLENAQDLTNALTMLNIAGFASQQKAMQETDHAVLEIIKKAATALKLNQSVGLTSSTADKITNEDANSKLIRDTYLEAMTAFIKQQLKNPTPYPALANLSLMTVNYKRELSKLSSSLTGFTFELVGRNESNELVDIHKLNDELNQIDDSNKQKEFSDKHHLDPIFKPNVFYISKLGSSLLIKFKNQDEVNDISISCATLNIKNTTPITMETCKKILMTLLLKNQDVAALVKQIHATSIKSIPSLNPDDPNFYPAFIERVFTEQAHYLFTHYYLDDIPGRVDSLTSNMTDPEKTQFKTFMIDYQIHHAQRINKWQRELFFGENLYALMHPLENASKTHSVTADPRSAAKDFYTTLQNKQKALRETRKIEDKILTNIAPSVLRKELKTKTNNHDAINSNHAKSISFANSSKATNAVAAQSIASEKNPLDPLIGLMLDQEKLYIQHIYQQYIKSIHDQILTDTWELGLLGGSPLRNANGEKLRDKNGDPIIRPKHIATIFNKHCVQDDKENNWEKHFQAIAAIGVAAKKPGVNFLGLTKRKRSTQKFYDSLTTYAENAGLIPIVTVSEKKPK